MAIDKNHYVGYYYKCVPTKGQTPIIDFADESFFLIYDEGQCREINDFHIYIPNKQCDGCHTLNKYSESGLSSVDNMSEWIVKAEQTFVDVYGSGNVSFTYGIITYSR